MTSYLSEPGVEFEISTFFVNIFKNRSKFKKVKKPLLDNFILFLKLKESHFLIRPNFCYTVQEKLNGYHGYWWISRKPRNFTKICGHQWIHLVFLIPEMYTFVHFCVSLLSNEMHKKPHFLFKAWVDTNLNINFCQYFTNIWWINLHTTFILQNFGLKLCQCVPMA